MKKIITVILSLLAVLFVFAGCSNSSTDTNSNTTKSANLSTTTATEETTAEETTRGSYAIIWDEVDSFQELQKIYWDGSPITKDTNGMTYHESTYETPGENDGEYIEVVRVTWIEDEDEVRYYNPRRAKDGTILYLDDYGYIDSLDEDKIHVWAVGNSYHGEEYEIIISSPEVTVFWSEEKVTLVEKVDNEVTQEIQLPVGSKYCGYSFWAGFIFQCEDKIYSVLAFQEEEDIVLAAEGVKTVIAVDYELTSDAWSNPLFLMEDGTLKGYITWDEELFEFDGAHGDTYYPYCDD